MLIRHHWAAAAPLLAACSSPLAAPPEAQGSGQASGTSIITPVAAAPARPVIAKLVTRDAELAIVASGTGPRFSIVSLEGAVLATDLGEAELEKQYPAIHQFYRSAIAHGGRSFLDASLSRSIVDRTHDDRVRGSPER